MAIMFMVAAKCARVLRGLVTRLPRHWLRYQVCYDGVNGHACGVQRRVCLIPRGRACLDMCLAHCVDCLRAGIIMAIPLVIAIVYKSSTECTSHQQNASDRSGKCVEK
ncbi:hypothetical protein ACFX2H_012256 [Malus domestica]